MNKIFKSDHARPATAAAEDSMGFQSDRAIDLRGERHTGTGKGEGFELNHRHVAIEWEGGVLWLDMSDLSNHYCMDVRWFDDKGNEQPVGIMAIEAGRRVTLDVSGVPENERVTNHKWPAAHMPIMLVDKA